MTSENRQSAPVLRRDDRGAVALLTLNRPSKLNALSNQLLAAIMHTLDQIELDPAIRVIVITGAEGAPSTGNHNYAYRGIEFDLIQGVHDRCEQLIAERIEFAGSVQREECDGSAVLPPQNENALSVFRSHRSTSFTAGGRRTVGRFRANGPTIGLA